MEAIEVSALPSVFEYDDYRRFLRDTYSFRKSERSSFSYRFLSSRAGFQSPNFFKLVIDGQRNLSRDSAQKVCLALKLNKAEAQFFCDLVEFNQSQDPQEKAASATRIAHLLKLRKAHPLKQAQYDYYSEWYFIPIREITSFPGFREDHEWIANQFHPPLTTVQVARALKDLERLGLIKRDTVGRLRPAHESLFTPDEVTSTLIASYHREMMKRAADSIHLVHRDEREISAVCIPASVETAQKLKSLVQKFKLDLLAIAAEDPAADRVYQLNFQLFPLTDVKKPRGNK